MKEKCNIQGKLGWICVFQDASKKRISLFFFYPSLTKISPTFCLWVDPPIGSWILRRIRGDKNIQQDRAFPRLRIIWSTSFALWFQDLAFSVVAMTHSLFIANISRDTHRGLSSRSSISKILKTHRSVQQCWWWISQGTKVSSITRNIILILGPSEIPWVPYRMKICDVKYPRVGNYRFENVFNFRCKLVVCR